MRCNPLIGSRCRLIPTYTHCSYCLCWHEIDNMNDCQLLRLPAELIVQTLQASPDLISLRSFSRSCRYIYGVFVRNEAKITGTVLPRQLNPALLREVWATHESSLNRHLWSRQERLAFILRFVDRNPPQWRLPSRWKLSEALAAARLYDHVRFFARAFAQKALSTNLSEFWAPKTIPDPPSPLEMTRIERSFYRFQICCDLFIDPRPRARDPTRPPERYDPNGCDLFYPAFSHWENEQLGSAYEYLFNEISPSQSARRFPF